MAAEITLFKPLADNSPRNGPVATLSTDGIVATYSATFTPSVDGIVRIFANGSVVTITADSISFTIPDGAIEWYGVIAGQQVTVA